MSDDFVQRPPNSNLIVWVERKTAQILGKLPTDRSTDGKFLSPVFATKNLLEYWNFRRHIRECVSIATDHHGQLNILFLIDIPNISLLDFVFVSHSWIPPYIISKSRRHLRYWLCRRSWGCKIWGRSVTLFFGGGLTVTSCFSLSSLRFKIELSHVSVVYYQLISPNW